MLLWRGVSFHGNGYGRVCQCWLEHHLQSSHLEGFELSCLHVIFQWAFSSYPPPPLLLLPQVISITSLLDFPLPVYLNLFIFFYLQILTGNLGFLRCLLVSLLDFSSSGFSGIYRYTHMYVKLSDMNHDYVLLPWNQCFSFLGQFLGSKGIEYSTPTLASAMSNLTPACTFILAVLLRSFYIYLFFFLA